MKKKSKKTTKGADKLEKAKSGKGKKDNKISNKENAKTGGPISDDTSLGSNLFSDNSNSR